MRLLLIGLLHAMTMMALPLVALVSNSTRRSRKLPRFAVALIVIGGVVLGFVTLQLIAGVIADRIALKGAGPPGSRCSSVADVTTVRVLGPIRVFDDDGGEVVLTGQRQRRLLSALILHRGRVVSIDRLAELVWDVDTMVDPAALQSLVFRLRQRVRGLDLEYRAPGYVLSVPDGDVDVERFERSCSTPLRDARGGSGARGQQLDEALRTLEGRAVRRSRRRRRRPGRDRPPRRAPLPGTRGAVRAGASTSDEPPPRSPSWRRSPPAEPLRERPRHSLIRAYESLGRRAEALRVVRRVSAPARRRARCRPIAGTPASPRRAAGRPTRSRCRSPREVEPRRSRQRAAAADLVVHRSGGSGGRDDRPPSLTPA